MTPKQALTELEDFAMAHATTMGGIQYVRELAAVIREKLPADPPDPDTLCCEDPACPIDWTHGIHSDGHGNFY